MTGLYYRIHVVPIHLPPLRERAGDIPLLCEFFLQMHCVANGLPVKRFAPDALSAFEEHSWPGNVRELENLIQRLVITVRGEEIRAQNLPPRLVASSLAAQEAVLLPQEGTDYDAEIQRVERALLNGGASADGGEQGCGRPAVAAGWSAD